jgi:septal ring factor EnvC (AmiA/AmiB activator)
MGTAMLGESGIEAAARRGRQRMQREQQQEEEALGNCPETIDRHLNEPQREEANHNARLSTGHSRHSVVQSRQQGLKGKLRRFKKFLTG